MRGEIGRGVGFRVTVRFLLILNLYVAVSIGLYVAIVGRVAPTEDRAFIPFAMLVWPLSMCLLTWALIRPGPRRDLLASTFGPVSFTAIGCWLVRAWTGQVRSSQSPSIPVGCGLLLLGVFCLGPAAWGVVEIALARRCPGCAHRALVRSSRDEMRRPARRMEGRFFWCCRCLGRFRLAGSPERWEDASGPEFDDAYELSSPGLVLSRLLRTVPQRQSTNLRG